MVNDSKSAFSLDKERSSKVDAISWRKRFLNCLSFDGEGSAYHNTDRCYDLICSIHSDHSSDELFERVALRHRVYFSGFHIQMCALLRSTASPR